MPTGQYVDKATFLNGCICPTRGWFARNLRHATPPSEADLLRMEEGLEIGRRARLLFPGGVFVPAKESTAAARETARLMADPKVLAIFEATFRVDGYVAKADILLRAKRGWRLLEVKSSINPSQELVDDLAYTARVAKRAGVKIDRASLLLLSGTYKLGDPDSDLFIERDCTGDVADIVGRFETLWDSVAKAALAKKPPAPQLMFACRSCEYFSTHCLGTDTENHIFELPRLSQTAFDRLAQQSVTAIPDIPAGFRLTHPQERVRQAIVTGQPVIAEKELAAFLDRIDWPAFYLDFETVKSSIPLFPGTAPHEQIVTQYSVHLCQAPGKVSGHREFLADASRDCRRELAERLLKDLDGAGHIVVYSSFEKTMLNKLGRLFDDLKPALDRCASRLFDLEKAFRSWFYHPEFHGRTSIKVTLPALVDLSYDGLAIADGDTAVAKYARMARGEIPGDAAGDVRQALLEYCKRDTLAMVKLHERLLKICS
ncbi:MAG: DUF2779 domain-containing protein [Planctomycetia bacterium]|nr:DUF2779 domain-containing protein [Planctomycetia bacterium]